MLKDFLSPSTELLQNILINLLFASSKSESFITPDDAPERINTSAESKVTASIELV